MGDQSTIKVLNSIYGLLQQVVRNQSQSTTDKQDNKNQRTVSDLNKGSLSNTNINNSSSSDIPKAKISVADVNALSGVPSVVLAIAGLNGRTMRNFNSVMNSLIQTITSFSKLDKTTTDGLKGIESLANGLDKLANARLVKLGISLAIVNATGIGKNFGKFVTEISSAINDKTIPDEKKITAVTEFITKVTPNIKKLALAAPLMPMFVLSAKMMSPGIKAYAKSIEALNNVKDPENAAKILKEMNTLVKSSAVLLGSTVAIGIAIKRVGAKEIFEGLAVNAGIILAVSGLAIAVAKAGSIMGRRSRKALDSISEFVGETMVVTSGIVLLSVAAGSRADQIKAGLPLVAGIFLGVSAIAITIGIVGTRINRRGRRGIRSITNFAASMILVTGALVLLSTIVTSSNDAIKKSFVLLGGVILATGALALVAAGVGLIITVARPLTNQVLKIAAFGIALTLGTVLLGSILQQGMPLLTYGIAGTSAVIVAYGAAILIPSLAIGALAKLGAPLMLEFMKIAAFGLAVTLGTIFVGYVLKEDIEGDGGVFYGTLGVGAVIFAYTYIIKGATRVAKGFNKVGMKSMYDVMKLIGLGLAITAATVGVGILIRRNKAETALAFIGLTAIMAEALAIAQFSSKNKTAFKKGIVDYKNVIILMGSAVVVLGAITGVGSLVKAVGGGDFWKGFAYVSSVFGLMTAVVAEAVLLSRLASRSGKTIVKGAQSLLLAEGILLASEVVLFGAVMIAKQLDKDTIGKVALTFVGMGIIVNGAASLAKLASKKRSVITKGAASLLLAESIILGSAVVLGSVVLLANKLEEVGYDKAAITLGAMIGVVGLSAGLALVASKIPKASIVNGLLTIGAIELLIVGSSLAMYSIIKVTDAFKTLGDGDLKKGRQQTAETILAMTAMLGYFGALAAAATFALPAVIGGVAAIALMDVFALGVSLFTLTIVGTLRRIENLGENPAEKLKTLKTLIVGDKENIGFRNIAWSVGNPVSLAAWTAGSIGFLAMLPMILSMSLASLSIIGVKNKLEKSGIKDVSELGTFTKSLTSIFTFDNFRLPIGPIERVRLLAQYTDMKPVFRGLKDIATGISKLVTTVGGMDDNDRIIPILGFKSSGEPIYGQPVNMAAVARNITDAIITFSEILSTDIAKLGNKDSKEIKASFEALSTILTPISNFAEVLSAFEDAGPGMLKAIKFDANGKKLEYPPVNVKNVATTIGQSILTFVNTLFGKDGISSDIIGIMAAGYDVVSEKKTGFAERKSYAAVAMGVLATVIDPVSNFVDTLTKFGEESDTEVLAVPVHDKDGNITSTRKVNVVKVAQTIANAISSFATTLFGSEQASEWIKTITEGGHYALDKKGNETGTWVESNAQIAMGSLASIIEPIVSFANMLSMFETAANSNKLFVYGQDGKKHEVDLLTAASSISSAITTFITNLSNELKGNTETLDFLKNNSEIISTVFSSFGESISSITNINAKDLDAQVKGVSKIFDFIIEKGNNDKTITSLSSLSESLDKLSNPLSTFINSFVQISVNDLGGNVNKFSQSLTGLSKSIDEIKKVADLNEANKINTFIKTLFGNTTFTAEDFQGLDTLVEKFKDYDNLLKSIASMKISDAAFTSLILSTHRFILFGTTIKAAANIVSSSIDEINIFVANKSKIIDFINLLSSDEINLRVNERQLISFSKSFKEFIGSILEIANTINEESLNALDLNSKKILDFVNSITASLTDNKVNPAAMTGFNNEFKKFIASIVSISNVDLTTAATDIITIKNSFEEYSDTIKSLNEIELAGVANTNEFSKSLDSLFTNILSMADKNKVVQSVQKTINLTTTSLTKLDNAFIKKNNDRIKELNKLNDTLKDLKDRLDDSSTGLGRLVDLVQALNKADTEKAKELLGEIGKTSTPKRGTSRRGGDESSGESSENTTLVNAGLTEDEIANAVSAGIAMAFEGAQIIMPKLTITGGIDESKTITTESHLQFDVVNNSKLDPNKKYF